MTSSLARALPAMLALAAAIVFGGGGSNSPGWELLLQLFFAAIIIAWALANLIWPRERDDSKPDRAILLLAGLVLFLPAIQLLPLPPSIWQALPGREVERQALELIGAGQRWMPWSMAPARTFASLLAMIPPAVLMVWASRLDGAGRRRLLGVIVAGGVASAILGALQLADGEGRQWRLQAETHLTWLTGFQANRNAEADVLLIAVLAAVACWVGMAQPDGNHRRREDGLAGWRLGLLLIAPLLLVALVLTGSRAGLLLLPVAGVFALRMAWPSGRRASPAIWIGSALALTMLTWAAVQVPAVGRVAERFAHDDIGRAKLWEDTQRAIAAHWPVGSGMGTFKPIFIASEQLKNVDPSMPVRAHNDWLEFTLEAGVPGWLVLGAGAGILIRRLWSIRRGDQGSGAPPEQVLFGLGAILLIALHSVGDYPLRSMSLSCLLAVAVAMLFPVSSALRRDPTEFAK